MRIIQCLVANWGLDLSGIILYDKHNLTNRREDRYHEVQFYTFTGMVVFDWHDGFGVCVQHVRVHADWVIDGYCVVVWPYGSRRRDYDYGLCLGGGDFFAASYAGC